MFGNFLPPPLPDAEHRPFSRKKLSSAKFCLEGRNKHFDNLFDIMEDVGFYIFFISHDSS